MTICDRLRELRLEFGFTQKAIAKEIGMTANTYHRYEYGERELPASKLSAVADVYNVSVDYLLGRTDKPEVNR